MILIIDTNFKKELELLSPNYPFDPSEFMFKKFYNSTDGSTYYPFFMRYVITEEDFLKAVDPIYLLQLKQKKIKPLIIMVTECWEFFLQSQKTKLSPYKKVINRFLEHGIEENEIQWIVNNINIEQEINKVRKNGTAIKAKFYHFNFFI